MTTIPLLYSWGFFAWLVNSKYKKMIYSVLFTGIILLPFYIQWGIMVLSEGIQSYYYNLPHFVYFRYLDLPHATRSRIEGGLIAIPLQVIIGLVISFVLMLWNRLIAQEKINQKAQPQKTLASKRQVIKPDKKKPSTTSIPSRKRKY